MSEEVYQIVVNSPLDSPPLPGLTGLQSLQGAGLPSLSPRHHNLSPGHHAHTISSGHQLTIRDGAVQLQVSGQMELDAEQVS